MTKEKTIVKAFHQFKQEYGHYPSAREIDACSYLPTARLIQRRFCGLVSFRGKLGLSDDELNLTKGPVRVKMAEKINKRELDYIQKVYPDLINIFGKIRVHVEHLFNYPMNKKRCDYFCFTPEGKTIIVDVFYAGDKYNFLGCLNHKMKKHENSTNTSPVYFVSMNNDLDVEEIMKNKKNQLKAGWKVINYPNFIEDMKGFAYSSSCSK